MEEPELVVVELEVDDELADEEEVLDEVLVDLRLAELTVPLGVEEPLLTEPVGPKTGVTYVEFAPAGTTAAGD